MTEPVRKCYKCNTPFRLTTVDFKVVCQDCEVKDALIQYGVIKN